MALSLAVIFWANVSLAGSSTTKDSSQAWIKTQDRFQHELERTVSLGKSTLSIPGGAVAIVIDGKLRYSTGMGKKQIDAAGRFSPDTLITVASITKMVTATTIMSLVQEGKIDLDRPVNLYLEKKGYRLQRRAQDQKLADTITMRHLLEHTSGLPDELPSGIADSGPVACTNNADAFRSYLRLHAGDPLWSPPGELWNYSNTGYFVAAAVIEALTGRPFEVEASERVLVPTHMDTASWDGTLVQREHEFAFGYEYRENQGRPAHLEVYSPSSTPCRVFRPAAGLKASVIDYAHFAEAFMARSGHWLDARSLDSLENPRRHTYVHGWDYSYGFFVNPNYKGVKVIAHDGVAWGYRSVVLMIPSRKFAFVAFHNVGLSLPERLWEQAFKAADLFLNLPEGDRAGPVVSVGELAGIVGEYRGWTYDYKNNSEANPKYIELDTQITFDTRKKELGWRDSSFGTAKLKSTWWPGFNVAYPDSRNNMAVRFIRSESGEVKYIVSREYVAKRVKALPLENHSLARRGAADPDKSLPPNT